MIVALILVALVQPLSLLIVCRYLARRDELERSERADLAQRIQDPTAAVATHVATRIPQQPSHLPFDDDAAWHKYVTETTP